MGLKPKVEGEMSQEVEEKSLTLIVVVDPVEMEETGEMCLAEAQEIKARRMKTEEEETKLILIIFVVCWLVGWLLVG